MSSWHNPSCSGRRRGHEIDHAAHLAAVQGGKSSGQRSKTSCHLLCFSTNEVEPLMEDGK